MNKEAHYSDDSMKITPLSVAIPMYLKSSCLQNFQPLTIPQIWLMCASVCKDNINTVIYLFK